MAQYRDRMKKILRELRLRGVLPSHVLRELRTTSDDDRWDGPAGEGLFQACLVALPPDGTTREELLSALGLADSDGYDGIPGDRTRGEWLVTGSLGRRVYGPGRYNMLWESFVYQTYCQCANDTRWGTEPHPEQTGCPVCVERQVLMTGLDERLLTQEVSESPVR